MLQTTDYRHVITQAHVEEPTFFNKCYKIQQDDSVLLTALKVGGLVMSLITLGLFSLVMFIGYSVSNRRDSHSIQNGVEQGNRVLEAPLLEGSSDSSEIEEEDSSLVFATRECKKTFQFPTNLSHAGSIQKIVNSGSGDVVFYGFKTCGYLEFAHSLNEHPTLKGLSYVSPMIREKFSDTSAHGLRPHQVCKRILTKIVEDNIARTRRGESIRPVLFLVDIDGNRDSISLLQRTEDGTRLVTASEMNRAKKMCEDPSLSDEVHEIAKRTFFYGKVKEENGVVVGVEKISPPVEASYRKRPKTERSGWRDIFRTPS